MTKYTFDTFWLLYGRATYWFLSNENHPFLYGKLLIKILFDNVDLSKFKFERVTVSEILKCMF